jgi:hypothetical protein
MLRHTKEHVKLTEDNYKNKLKAGVTENMPEVLKKKKEKLFF